MKEQQRSLKRKFLRKLSDPTATIIKEYIDILSEYVTRCGFRQEFFKQLLHTSALDPLQTMGIETLPKFERYTIEPKQWTAERYRSALAAAGVKVWPEASALLDRLRTEPESASDPITLVSLSLQTAWPKVDRVTWPDLDRLGDQLDLDHVRSTDLLDLASQQAQRFRSTATWSSWIPSRWIVSSMDPLPGSGGIPRVFYCGSDVDGFRLDGDDAVPSSEWGAGGLFLFRLPASSAGPVPMTGTRAGGRPQVQPLESLDPRSN